MTGHVRGSNVVSLIATPLCAVLLLTGLFGLIWLRSSIITVAYDLRTLEEQKMESLKEAKILLAERAKLVSVDKITASFRGAGPADGRASSDNIFSNRVRVIHVKRNRPQEPLKAAYQGGEQAGP